MAGKNTKRGDCSTGNTKENGEKATPGKGKMRSQRQLTLIVDENVLGFEVTVDDAQGVEVLQPQRNFRGVEACSTLGEARSDAHIMDVELKVAPVHDGQYKAQRILRLKGVG